MTVVYCPKCEIDNAETNVFCRNCNHQLRELLKEGVKAESQAIRLRHLSSYLPSSDAINALQWFAFISIAVGGIATVIGLIGFLGNLVESGISMTLVDSLICAGVGVAAVVEGLLIYAISSIWHTLIRIADNTDKQLQALVRLSKIDSWKAE